MARVEIAAPATGTVWKVERAVGERVEEGDVIMILESMKMEIPVEASVAGTVASLHAETGASVEEDQLLCVVQS